MTWYLLLWSDKDNAAIYAWSILGLATKLAQAVSATLVVGSIFLI